MATYTTNKHVLSDTAYDLFMRVISAALEGRYYYGNGALWYINEWDRKLVIDTISNTVTEVPHYEGTMHSDAHVVSSLRDFLRTAHTESYDATHTGSSMEYFVDLLVQAAAANRVLFGNGAYYVFMKENGTVIWLNYVSGNRGEIQVSTMTKLGSWQYREMMQNERIPEYSRQWILEHNGINIRKCIYRIAS